MLQEYPSFSSLQALAKSPIDLSEKGALTPERIADFSLSFGDISLLFGTERVTEEVLQALWSLAREAAALEKMGAMQRGEVVNAIEGFASEKRAALHTAVRDVSGKGSLTSVGEELRAKGKKEREKLQAFLDKIGDRFTDCIQIGIGGSDLGPKALALALEPFYLPKRRIFSISNVDGDDAERVLKKVDLARTLVIVVSKSGTTLETRANEELVRARMAKKGLRPEEHFVAVTGEKSPMDDPSRYLASFYIWDAIGGRYSATSMVGGVLLGFALGYAGFLEILEGAEAIDRHAREASYGKNLPLLSALLGVWNRNFLQLPTLAIIPYAQGLERFPAHLQQLDMESNGKRIDKKGRRVEEGTGPIVWGEPGTNAQHSFFQLLHQGTDVVPVEFIAFRQSQYPQSFLCEGTQAHEKVLANMWAQSLGLAMGKRDENPNRFFAGNRPNRVWLLDRLTPKNLGALLALYEHKVAFQGFLWGINSFDQEGVQLGKVLAGTMLELFRAKREKRPGASFPLGEVFFSL